MVYLDQEKLELEQQRKEVEHPVAISFELLEVIEAEIKSEKNI